MTKYISLNDFEKVVTNVTEKITEHVRNSRIGHRHGIFTVIITREKGKIFSRCTMTNIKGFVLSNESPKVEQINYGCPEYPTIKVVITFDIDHIVFKTKDTMDLPEPSYTFNTYEEYLKFLTERYQEITGVNVEDIDILTEVKGHYVSIPSILVDFLVHRQKFLTDHTENQFTNLKRYSELPAWGKLNIDRVICPITVRTEDIRVNSNLDFIYVKVEKEELMNESFQTNYWDEFISRELKDVIQHGIPV